MAALREPTKTQAKRSSRQGARQPGPDAVELKPSRRQEGTDAHGNYRRVVKFQ